MHGGGDYASISDDNNAETRVARHRYRVRESRFDVVINMDHIEPRRFLEETGGVVI